MPLDDRNKLNRLEELKSKLFSKEYQNQIEYKDGFSTMPKRIVMDSWDTTGNTGENVSEKNYSNANMGQKFLAKTSFFKKFFVFSMIVFILSLCYAGYVFFIGGNTVSNNNIDISVLGNNFTAGGQKLSLVVGITNRNNSELELADLVMEYGTGSSDDPSSNTQDFRQSIGTIPAGAVVNENVTPVLFGEQGSTDTIKFSLEYRVPGSNAIFVKDTTYNVTINSTPINLSVDGPVTVSPNQSITLNVKETLNSTTPTTDVLTRVDYPIGFQFTSAVPAPAFGNNVWDLGDLTPGAEHDISITGTMVGVSDGDEKTFNISSGTQSDTDKSVIGVVFNSIQQNMTVQKPFVEADLSINGVSQGPYAVDTKTPIDAVIQYSNNLDTKVDDVVITAKITGNAFDPSTVQAQQGFYNSANNTITWDKSSIDALAGLNPGDSGTVQFSLSPLALFSAAGGILSNPSVNIEVDISGEQSNTDFTTSSITNSDTATINIISDVGFSTGALYSSGAFTNTGPIPPKVGQATTYTVVWSLSNTANNISNSQVTATLPSWMTFVGPFSPTSENLSYDPSTSTVLWNVGNIASGTGITSAARTVSFQVSLTPSLSQVGDEPTIINDAILTGHDDFANVDVKVDKGPLTTDLQNDPSFPADGGNVTN